MRETSKCIIEPFQLKQDDCISDTHRERESAQAKYVDMMLRFKRTMVCVKKGVANIETQSKQSKAYTHTENTYIYPASDSRRHKTLAEHGKYQKARIEKIFSKIKECRGKLRNFIRLATLLLFRKLDWGAQSQRDKTFETKSEKAWN